MKKIKTNKLDLENCLPEHKEIYNLLLEANFDTVSANSCESYYNEQRYSNLFASAESKTINKLIVMCEFYDELILCIADLNNPDNENNLMYTFQSREEFTSKLKEIVKPLLEKKQEKQTNDLDIELDR